MDRNNTINETSEERRRRLNRERQQRYRKNKRNTGLDHSGEKKVRIQYEVSNAIDETSEGRRRRLNREQQQRYRKNKRNMDSEGSTGLISEGNMTTRAEQEVVIHLTTVLLKTLKARIYPWSSQGLDRHSLGSMNHRCNRCCFM